MKVTGVSSFNYNRYKNVKNNSANSKKNVNFGTYTSEEARKRVIKQAFKEDKKYVKTYDDAQFRYGQWFERDFVEVYIDENNVLKAKFLPEKVQGTPAVRLYKYFNTPEYYKEEYVNGRNKTFTNLNYDFCFDNLEAPGALYKAASGCSSVWELSLPEKPREVEYKEPENFWEIDEETRYKIENWYAQ